MLEVEKECDKAANETIGRRNQFSKQRSKEVEEEQKEEGLVPLQAVERRVMECCIILI